MRPFFLYVGLLLVTVLGAEDGNQATSLLVEGTLGRYHPTLKKFNEVYKNNDLMPSIGLGIGYKHSFLIARYRKFETRGKSIIKGVDLEGRAEWYQEFISLGIRSYANDGTWLEIAYVIGSVSESISTADSKYPALESEILLKNREGISFGLGIQIPLLLGFHLSGNLEYIFVDLPGKKKLNLVRQNMAGPFYGIGLTFACLLWVDN